MTITAWVESCLTSINLRMMAHARRNRISYGMVAGTLFFGGTVASVIALDLDWRRLEVQWLLINLLVGAPVAIALNAIGLRISAGVVGASLSFTTAFRICCIALCSNVLPIPAGSLIQASSLASRGASALRSGLVVVIGNAMSLALVTILVGSILTSEKPALGFTILALGISGLLTVTTLLLMKTTVRVMLAFLVIRLVRTIITVFRIQVTFLGIGLAVSALDAALFSGAIILGTVVAVIPAGLGVSESLAALLALATTIAPSAAFLATALNRLLTLAFAGLFLLASQSESTNHKVS